MKIKLGKQYKNGDGEIKTLRVRASEKYPFMDESGRTYTADGKNQIGENSEKDLVSEVITLKDGGKYKSKSGKIEIVFKLSNSTNSNHVFKGQNGIFYTKKGMFYCDEIPSQYDLIEEIEDEPAKLTELPQSFSVRIVNETISRIIQEHFFKNGICWNSGDKNYLTTVGQEVIYFGLPGYTGIARGTEKHNVEKGYPIISLEEFLSLPFPKKEPTLELSPGYVAVVKKDKVVVGEIEVSFATVREIYRALNEPSTVLPEKFGIWTPTKELYDIALTKLKEIYKKEPYSHYWQDKETCVFYNYGNNNRVAIGNRNNKDAPLIDIAKMWEEKPVAEIKINNRYTAVIKDGTVSVGCQKNIGKDKIEALVALLPA